MIRRIKDKVGKSILYKMYISFVTFLFLIIGVILVLNYNTSRKTILQFYKDQGQDIIISAASNVIERLGVSDMDSIPVSTDILNNPNFQLQLLDLLSKVSIISNVTGMAFLDSDFNIVLSAGEGIDANLKAKVSHRPRIEGDVLKIADMRNLLFMEPMEFTLEIAEEELLFQTDEELQPSGTVITIGYTVLLMSLEDFNRRIASIVKMTFIIGVGMLFISIFLITLILGRFTKPVREIINATLQIAKGDYRVRLGFRGGDEFGQIANSIDLMVKDLELNVDELASQKEYTENIVTTIPSGLIVMKYVSEKSDLIKVETFNAAWQKMDPEGTILPTLLPMIKENIGKTVETVDRRTEFEQKYDNSFYYFRIRRIKSLRKDEALMLLIVDDITERKTAEVALQEAHDQLESRVKERTGELINAIERLHQEIGERKIAEEALIESKERFRTLVENIQTAVYRTTPDGKIVDANPAFIKMFGYNSFDKLSTLNIEDTYGPGYSRREFRELVESNGEIRDLETTLRKSDGTMMIVRERAKAILDGNGEILYYEGTIDDITERKRAEEAILESEERFRAIASTAKDAIIVMDSKGCVSYWNPAAELIFGYSRQEAIGRQMYKSIAQEEYFKAYLKMFAAVVKTGERRAVGRILERDAIRKDGKEFPVEISVSGVHIKGQLHFVEIIRDVSERKQIEVQLRQSQKMEAIGSLAAGIAHEINTPAQYVGGNLEFLEDAFNRLNAIMENYNRIVEAVKTDSVTPTLVVETEATSKDMNIEFIKEEIPSAIQEAKEGIARLTKIVSAMKDLAHPGEGKKSDIDINKAIESTITVSRNEWKYVADMQTDFDPDLPPVPCLPGEFSQAILNIIVNAAHAIDDMVSKGEGIKGTITISTRRNGDWIEIRISDTGSGIPEKIRLRIFDPFFTTREVGKGTGQGLAIAHSAIVDKNNGTITFETEVDKGTTFIIRLPLEDEDRESDEAIEENSAY